jgi:hypothetical protein
MASRRDEARAIATKAYNVAAEIINEAPDKGVALAAASYVVRYLQSEIDSETLLGIDKLANIDTDNAPL